MQRKVLKYSIYFENIFYYTNNQRFNNLIIFNPEGKNIKQYVLTLKNKLKLDIKKKI